MNPAPPDPSSAPSKPFKAEIFGRYYLVDQIATGGMAEIFKAKTFGHGGFENIVVIKKILSHISENPQFVRMFMDEAKITALLQHGNIVRIYDFGKLDKNYFIAMECVEGKDVKQLLRKLAERRKLIPREFAVYIAMEAAKGLDYAHKRTTLQGSALNIVHRDVSPSNILVSYNGEIKVADFGIVKAANLAEDTDHGMLKGKFEYMSPEQASGKDIDRRSDIFSLGIILWEMLTGRRLFKTDGEIKTLEKIKSGDFEPPSSVNHTIPARLDEIVMRALSVNADDRYADARDLHADLLDFLYPAPPDVTQQSLSHFMRDLFSEETQEERQRMEDGTAQALSLHESASSLDLEPDWQESGSTTSNSVIRPPAEPQPPPPPVAPPSQTPMVLIGVLLLLLLIAVLALIWVVNAGTQDTKAPEAMELKVEVATSSTIRVKVSPVAGRVSLDGNPVGEASELKIDPVVPGVEHLLRVEAEGYEPYEERLTLEAGATLPVPVVLKPAQKAPEQKDPKDAEGPPRLWVTSSPSGAEVYIDGRLRGKTPMEWPGDPGEKMSVEVRLSGYQTQSGRITLPQSGRERHSFSLARAEGAAPATTPAATPAVTAEAPPAPGKVTVTIRGGGYGILYIDGKKKGEARGTFDLPAGPHTLRVTNDEIGWEQSKSVNVEPGKAVTVNFEQ